MSDKLWGGRFSGGTSELMEAFNASINFDKKLYKQDIAGSRAHAKMLNKIHVFSDDELKKVLEGLDKVQADIEADRFEYSLADEDIHMAIEKQLTSYVGDLGKKLHTGRSRNDQVATDMRLYLREAVDELKEQLLNLLKVIHSKAKDHRDFILPGLTHLQAAQPVSLSFHLLAWFFMLERDLQRLLDLRKRMNRSPLGSGALAGVNYASDREMTASELGFDAPTYNAMESVADRDYLMEYGAFASILMVHLSRFNEELILWSSQLFNFAKMDDAFSTGSSIMPNKKNPDACELIRGKSGRVLGQFINIATVLKSLPMAYNKDMQEDKEAVFDSVENLGLVLAVMSEMLKTTRFNKKAMRSACERGFLQATDVADYLSHKGLPFRDAHHVSGSIVRYLEEKEKTYESLSMNEWKQFSELFEMDIAERIQLENLVEAKQSQGGTGSESVAKQLLEAEALIAQYGE